MSGFSLHETLIEAQASRLPAVDEDSRRCARLRAIPARVLESHRYPYALLRHDDVLAVASEQIEEHPWVGLEVALEEELAGLVNDDDEHGPRMKIGFRSGNGVACCRISSRSLR